MLGFLKIKLLFFMFIFLSLLGSHSFRIKAQQHQQKIAN
jgi:hypothetical protein